LTQGAGNVRIPEYPLSREVMSAGMARVNWKSWVTFPVYLLVFLMLVFPMVFELSRIKLFLFVVILGTVGVAVLRSSRLYLHPALVVWTLSLSALSFLFVLEGFFKGAPVAGTIRQTQVYVVWPMIYLLVIAGARSKRILFGLMWTIAISTICVPIYALVYTLIQTNVLPENRYFDLISFNLKDHTFGLDDGFVAMDYPGINSLPFLVPFSMALASCLSRVTGVPRLFRVSLWTGSLLSLGAVLLSGRRAFYLVALGAPFLTLLFQSFQPIQERRRSRTALIRVAIGGVLALVIAVVALNASYGVSLAGLENRLAVGFDFSPTTEDHGATERRIQYHALLAGWMESPLFGAGHGAPAFGSIRSQESPWSYELYYMALLYQTGLVGFVAYTAGIMWIYWNGVQVIRSGGYLSALMVACLVGMSFYLAATATNPYLARYDAMWVIFLPLALINHWHLRSSERQALMKLGTENSLRILRQS
jgi:hypothetical protein